MSTIRQLAICFVLVLVTSSLGQSQGTTSRVIGVVTDSSGAVVPGANVTLTNQTMNVSFATKTTSAGTYVFDSVQVGTYTISIQKEGFEKFVSTDNVLTIGQPMTVNARLQVGQVAQSVSVSATAELVQTGTSGNIGNLVNEQTIQQLPIVGVRGRNPLNFINFQPGVVVGGNTGGGVNINGTRDRAQNFTLDGIDINEDSAGGSDFSPLRVNPDSISQFRVLTSNFTADYGRNSGGEVTMVTQQGTNHFHGDAFWFYQTPRLQANQYSNNEFGIGKPQFVQHIYGGSVGGPIWKNKTFFFVNLQRLHTNETAQITSDVYTAQARKGIFRYVVSPGKNAPAGSSNASVDANGNVLPGVNVATYDVAANDPQARGLDATVQQVLGLTPLPNNFTVGDGLNVAGFSSSSPQSEQQQDFTIRVDHAFNDRNTLFGRWANGHQNTLGDSVNGGLAPFPTAPRVVDTERSPRNLAVGWRTIPTNSTTNELVLGFNRFTFNFANPDPNFLKNPIFAFSNVTNPFQNYVGNLRALTTYQLVDNFTWVRAAHTFRWGINFLYTRHIDRRGSVGAFNVQPFADFSTSVDPVDATAFNLPTNMDTKADQPRLEETINELLGRIGNVEQSFVAAGSQFAPAGSVYDFDARYPEYDFYGMDTWKLRPNLTVDLGLRWAGILTPRDPRSRIAHPDQPFVVGAPPSSTLNWVKGPLYSNAWANLSPSVGVAWDPFGTGKTSIRANYRLAYDPVNTFSLSSAIFQSLPGQTFSVDNTAFGQAGGRIADGIPTLAPPAGVSPSSLTQPAAFSTTSTTVIDPNWKPAEVNEWSLSVERQLPSKMVLSVNYIGHHAVHLYGGYDANQVDIFQNGFLGAFNTVAAGGDSTLMDNLLVDDPKVQASGQTGSQWVQSNFKTTLGLGSVAGLAQALATRTTAAGVPVYVASGFSPFFFMPYPQFSGGLNVLDSNDHSSYNSLQVELARRLSQSLTYQFGYTWSHSLDTRSYDPTFTRVSRGAAQSSSSTPYDIHNRNLNYASSDFDRRNVFYGDWVWTLPFGEGQRWGSHLNSIVKRIVGGWETAGILTTESGRPFTIYSGSFTFNNDVESPASCSGCSFNMGNLQLDPKSGRLFLISPGQKSLFSTPAPGQLGNTGRNGFNYPPIFDLDLDLAKRTQITEGQSLEFRVEMTNATNTPQWEFMDSSIITSSVFGRESFPINSSRRIQLGLKYYF